MKKIRFKNILILVGIIVVGLIAMHLVVIFYLRRYPVTSGLLGIILIGTVLLILNHLFNKGSKNYRNFNVLIFSFSLTLFLIEMVVVITGITSTYVEKRDKWFYTSSYAESSKGYLHVWSQDHYLTSAEFSFFREINSENLPDINHPVPKPANEFRILALGDSFTEGDGAAADSTWLKFLEYSLKKKPLAKQLRYINAGVCGSDPFFEYMLLKTKLLKYKPDLVILCINSSDIEDIRIRGGWERFKADGTVIYNNPPWWEPLYAGFRFLRPAFHLAGYNEMLLKENDPQSFDPESGKKLEAVIEAFGQLATLQNFRLLVVFHPTRAENEAGNAPWSKLARDTEKNGVYDVLDLLQYFKVTRRVKPENSYLYYWPYDGHHNSRGYAAFAEGVEWKLLQTGILDSLINR